MDQENSNSWKNYFANGFEASKGFLYRGTNANKDDQGLYNNSSDKDMEVKREYVYGSLIVNNEDLESWKKTLGKGFDISKGVLYGNISVNREDLVRWKSSVGKGFGAVKDSLNGTVVSMSKIDSESLKNAGEKGLEVTKSLMYGSLAIMNSDMGGWKGTFDGAKGFLKGNQMFNSILGNKYLMKITNAGQVNILDKATKNWVFRMDRPHKGADYIHININPKYSGLRRDPHFPLPPGSLHASRGVARVAKVINKVSEVAIPIVIAIDVYQLSKSAIEDYDNKTTRKTVETSAKIASGWVGGFTGATTGSAIGTAILPGIGTIVGGVAGALGGAAGFSKYTDAVVVKIADKYNYDVAEKKCDDCNETIKIRKYKGEKIDDTHKECKLDAHLKYSFDNDDFSFISKL